MEKEQQINEENLPQEIISGLKNNRFQRIVVLIGAGISVAAGIPDFRSPKTGYFDNFQEFDVPYPEALFELDYFKENPIPLYRFVWGIHKLDPKPTNAHYFLRVLAEKKLISKIFTQNIDGLEERAGIKEDLIINAHGCLRSLKCSKCRKTTDLTNYAKNQGEVIYCKCGTLQRPNVLFYEEKLPQKFWKNLDKVSEADLVLVMGTSLKVSPFDKIVGLISKETPILVINKEKLAINHHKVSFMQGDAEKTSLQLIDALNFRHEFEKYKILS